jgi:predicted membrane protein
VGEVSIDVPDGAAVRIDANTGLGEIDVPSDYAQVSGDDNDGVWESPAYNSDARQVNISFNGGIGGLEIR